MQKSVSLSGFKISDDNALLDEQHAITPQLKHQMGKLHGLALKGKPASVQKFLNLIEMHPHTPQLKVLVEKKEMLDMVSRYTDITSTWASYREEEIPRKEFPPQERPHWGNAQARPIVNENKTGRNDPCPCGSGKKYQKCCLK